MAVGRLNEHSLRPPEHLLSWGFAISIAAHVVFFGGFELGQRQGWWKKDLMPAWLKQVQKVVAEAKKNQPVRPVTPQEAPLLFVEVDPAAAIPQPPKDAKYYSSKNSQAANTEATLDTTTPKIDGSQTHVIKTETAPRSKPAPLQPSPPPQPQPQPQTAPPNQEADTKPKPKGGPVVGDLALAKPVPRPAEGEGEAITNFGKAETPAPARERPRTLAEAKMRQALAGEKMKQEGGVHRRLEINSLDARATPFGEYDRELIEAIQNRWYDLLDSKTFSRDRTGKVVVDFNLNSNGRVTDMRVVENDVDDLLCYVCQRAIIEPAPFAPWPSDMRRLVGGDVREVRFTFFYE